MVFYSVENSEELAFQFEEEIEGSEVNAGNKRAADVFYKIIKEKCFTIIPKTKVVAEQDELDVPRRNCFRKWAIQKTKRLN